MLTPAKELDFDFTLEVPIPGVDVGRPFVIHDEAGVGWRGIVRFATPADAIVEITEIEGDWTRRAASARVLRDERIGQRVRLIFCHGAGEITRR